MKGQVNHSDGKWYDYHSHEYHLDGPTPGTERFGAILSYSLWGFDYGSVKYTSRYSAKIDIGFSPLDVTICVNLFRFHLLLSVHGNYLESVQPESIKPWEDFSDYPTEPQAQLDYLDIKLVDIHMGTTTELEQAKATMAVYERLSAEDFTFVNRDQLADIYRRTLEYLDV